MRIIETKKGDKYRYNIGIKNGEFYWETNKKIREEDTEQILDEIYLKISNMPKSEGEFNYKGYKINFYKKMEKWI